jgi:hypothetical protein
MGAGERFQTSGVDYFSFPKSKDNGSPHRKSDPELCTSDTFCKLSSRAKRGICSSPQDADPSLRSG